MNTTSVSLLRRLRQPGQGAAWARFVELYTPLLFHWAHRAGLRGDHAADLVQDVFALLVQKLPEFTCDERKSFRAWLRTVTVTRTAAETEARHGDPRARSGHHTRRVRMRGGRRACRYASFLTRARA